MPAAGKKLTLKDSTGHFQIGAVDGTLTVDGAFTVVNGYTGENKACTLKKLVGGEGATIVDGLADAGATASPIIYVQDWTEWQGEVVLPEENALLNVRFSVAKSADEYFYTAEAVAQALDRETPPAEIVNLSLTDEQLAAAGLQVGEGGVITKKESEGPTEEDLQAVADAAAAAIVAAIAAGETTVTVDAPKGGSYQIVGTADVLTTKAAEADPEAWRAAEGGSVTLPIPQIDGTKAFFKVMAK